jgi:hypothetical protein
MTAQLRQCSRCRLYFPSTTEPDGTDGVSGWACAACAALGTPVAMSAPGARAGVTT